MKKLYFIVFIWSLTLFFCRLCIAEIPLNKDLISLKEKSQTEITKLKSKASVSAKETPTPTSTPSTDLSQNDKSKTEDVKDGENEKEESKADKNDELLRKYKLIGIYLIGSQPRALIKNLEETQDGTKEYQQGDFLDDALTFSVSKISFNPTARVELIDQDGINYLIKPYSLDVKNLSGSPKGNFAIKKAPTYSSGPSSATSKAKNRSSSSSDTSNKSPEQPVAAEQAPPSTIATPAAAVDAGTKKDAAAEDSQKNAAGDASGSLQPQQQPLSADSVQGAAMSAGSSDGAPQQTQKTDSKNPLEQQKTPSDLLDTSRPANPFQ